MLPKEDTWSCLSHRLRVRDRSRDLLGICCPLTLALGNGAGEGSILGSLVIPVTVVTVGVCI